MGDLFWNKVAAAGLALFLGVIAIMELGHVLVHAHEDEDLAYPVDLSVLDASTGGEPEIELPTDYGLLLAAASVDSGGRAVRQCASCHSFDEGGANGVGPNLWNVVNRAVAGVDGFGYSAALSDLGGEWSYEALDGFLTRPANYARGTSMSFAGVRSEETRMDIIAYLRSLSASPAPLPAPLADAASESVEAVEEAMNSVVDDAETQAAEAPVDQAPADEAPAEDAPAEDGPNDTPQD